MDDRLSLLRQSQKKPQTTASSALHHIKFVLEC